MSNLVFVYDLFKKTDHKKIIITAYIIVLHLIQILFSLPDSISLTFHHFQSFGFFEASLRYPMYLWILFQELLSNCKWKTNLSLNCTVRNGCGKVSRYLRIFGGFSSWFERLRRIDVGRRHGASSSINWLSLAVGAGSLGGFGISSENVQIAKIWANKWL